MDPRQNLSERQSLEADILRFIQNEIQDRHIVLTMDTPIEAVIIDSIDIARVLFKMEDKYGQEFDPSFDAPPQTVGQIVDTLVDAILDGRQG